MVQNSPILQGLGVLAQSLNQVAVQKQQFELRERQLDQQQKQFEANFKLREDQIKLQEQNFEIQQQMAQARFEQQGQFAQQRAEQAGASLALQERRVANEEARTLLTAQRAQAGGRAGGIKPNQAANLLQDLRSLAKDEINATREEQYQQAVQEFGLATPPTSRSQFEKQLNALRRTAGDFTTDSKIAQQAQQEIARMETFQRDNFSIFTQPTESEIDQRVATSPFAAEAQVLQQAAPAALMQAQADLENFVSKEGVRQRMLLGIQEVASDTSLLVQTGIEFTRAEGGIDENRLRVFRQQLRTEGVPRAQELEIIKNIIDAAQ